MKIGIIGSGNVATYFGLALHQTGWHIQQVYSPQLVNAAILASQVAAQPIDNLAALDASIDVFIIALKDDAFQSIQNCIPLKNKIIIHCSGSNSLQVFSALSEKRGVIWPLYSVNKNALPLSRNIPLIIDATDGFLMSIIERIAFAISDNIHQLNDEARTYLHLNAVLVNNFTNYLLSMAERICEIQKIDFNILLPIIQQSLAQTRQLNFSERQTGPAIRGDYNTINKHVDLLQNMGMDTDVYIAITNAILQSKNPQRS